MNYENKDDCYCGSDNVDVCNIRRRRPEGGCTCGRQMPENRRRKRSQDIPGLQTQR
jgi:hypothetical protein